jgi:hypothetical protein
VPIRGEDGAEFFFALGFAGAHLAAAAGVFVAAELVFGFGEDLRDFDAVAGGVYGYEGEVGRGDVAELLLADVFDHATKSRWSMEAVTVKARAWRLAAMAPTRSMNCMRRPPKRLPRALVSAGKMISLRSDWEALTGLELGRSDILLLYWWGWWWKSDGWWWSV